MRELNVIPNGALLISGGVIQEVGVARRVERLAEARNAIEVDATGKVVMPGLVDCFTRPLGPPFPLDDYEARCASGALPPWDAEDTGAVPAHVRAMREMPAQALESQGRRRLRQFLRHGTTTIEASSGYGLDEATELRVLRLLSAFDEAPIEIAATYGGVRSVAPEFSGRSDDYLDWARDTVLPRLQKRRLASFVEIAPAPYPPAALRRFLDAVAAAGLRTRVMGDWRFAIETGAPALGGSWADTAEAAAALSAAATVAIVTPAADFHHGRPFAGARGMIDAGVPIALATGFGADCSPSASLPFVLSLACASMRLTPAEALTAATINAACALERSGRVGSLEVGKDADVILLTASDYREIPLHIGVNLVAGVIKRGVPLFPSLAGQPSPPGRAGAAHA